MVNKVIAILTAGGIWEKSSWLIILKNQPWFPAWAQLYLSFYRAPNKT